MPIINYICIQFVSFPIPYRNGGKIYHRLSQKQKTRLMSLNYLIQVKLCFHVANSPYVPVNALHEGIPGVKFFLDLVGILMELFPAAVFLF